MNQLPSEMWYVLFLSCLAHEYYCNQQPLIYTRLPCSKQLSSLLLVPESPLSVQAEMPEQVYRSPHHAVGNQRSWNWVGMHFLWKCPCPQGSQSLSQRSARMVADSSLFHSYPISQVNPSLIAEEIEVATGTVTCTWSHKLFMKFLAPTFSLTYPHTLPTCILFPSQELSLWLLECTMLLHILPLHMCPLAMKCCFLLLSGQWTSPLQGPTQASCTFTKPSDQLPHLSRPPASSEQSCSLCSLLLVLDSSILQILQDLSFVKKSVHLLLYCGVSISRGYVQ